MSITKSQVNEFLPNLCFLAPIACELSITQPQVCRWILSSYEICVPYISYKHLEDWCISDCYAIQRKATKEQDSEERSNMQVGTAEQDTDTTNVGLIQQSQVTTDASSCNRLNHELHRGNHANCSAHKHAYWMYRDGVCSSIISPQEQKCKQLLCLHMISVLQLGGKNGNMAR